MRRPSVLPPVPPVLVGPRLRRAAGQAHASWAGRQSRGLGMFANPSPSISFPDSTCASSAATTLPGCMNSKSSPNCPSRRRRPNPFGHSAFDSVPLCPKHLPRDGLRCGARAGQDAEQDGEGRSLLLRYFLTCEHIPSLLPYLLRSNWFFSPQYIGSIDLPCCFVCGTQHRCERR